MYVCIYIYIHTYAHTHTHTSPPSRRVVGSVDMQSRSSKNSLRGSLNLS